MVVITKDKSEKFNPKVSKATKTTKKKDNSDK